MNAPLAVIFEYNRWANRAIIEACERLDEPALDTAVAGTYGSVRDMLVHVISGQDNYVGHLSGDSRRYLAAQAMRSQWPGFEALRLAAERSDAGLIEVARALDTDGLVTLPPWEGVVYTSPGSFILLQAISHGIEHRSQICTTLTQTGVTPPELDGWAFATAASLLEPKE